MPDYRLLIDRRCCCRTHLSVEIGQTSWSIFANGKGSGEIPPFKNDMLPSSYSEKQKFDSDAIGLVSRVSHDADAAGIEAWNKAAVKPDKIGVFRDERRNEQTSWIHQSYPVFYERGKNWRWIISLSHSTARLGRAHGTSTYTMPIASPDYLEA